MSRLFDRGLFPLWAAATAATTSCSLRTLDYDECETNSECRAAYGLGSVCGGDGYCSEPIENDRCTQTFPEDLMTSTRYAESPVFGSLFDRRSETHVAREKSIRLAVSQVNSEGGLDGVSFGVVFCNIDPDLDPDTADTLDGALDAADYLTNVLEVPALLGPAGSTDVAGVFEAVRSSGTLVLSPSATSPALTTADETSPSDESPGLLWRTAPPDSLQGRVIAQDLTTRGRTSVAVIAQSGAYGEGLTNIFLGGYSGDVDRRVFNNSNQMSEAIAVVGASTAQEVLFIASSQQDVIAFLDAAALIDGFNDKAVFLTDSAATQDMLDSAPASILPRIRGTRPSPLTERDPVYGNFIASYAAQYQEDATQFSFTAHAYDMAWMAMLGAAWAVEVEGALTGRNMAKGLRKLSSGPALSLTPSNWNSMRQRFRSAQSFNMAGASGALDYDPNTEETNAPIDVWRVDTTSTPAIVTEYTME